jgi:hypothetical protein
VRSGNVPVIATPGGDEQAMAHLVVEQLPCSRTTSFYQRSKDDPAGLAADKGNVGKVEAADLLDAGGNASVVLPPAAFLTCRTNGFCCQLALSSLQLLMTAPWQSEVLFGSAAIV